MPSLWQPDPRNDWLLQSKEATMLFSHAARHGIMFNSNRGSWRSYRIGRNGEFDPSKTIEIQGQTFIGGLRECCAHYPELRDVVVKMMLLAISIDWLAWTVEQHRKKKEYRR